MASAAMNSTVLASCNYAAISGSGSAAISELNPKTTIMMMKQPAASSKLPQKQRSIITAAATTNTTTTATTTASSRRAALLFLAATAFTAASNSLANAGVIDDYLEKSKANKELNDKERLATSGANFARAFTVQFGSCKFPENFTGCQDLAKQKKVPFISDDLSLECEGKDKYKCGSNVFWKW